MSATHVGYEAAGWGVGEVWLEGAVLLHHELPRAGPLARGSHELGERFRRYFAGGPDDFLDVELDLEGATEFERELTAALRRVPRGETVTYGGLATLAGRPRGARAAGAFWGGNRFRLAGPGP